MLEMKHKSAACGQRVLPQVHSSRLAATQAHSPRHFVWHGRAGRRLSPLASSLSLSLRAHCLASPRVAPLGSSLEPVKGDECATHARARAYARTHGHTQRHSSRLLVWRTWPGARARRPSTSAGAQALALPHEARCAGTGGGRLRRLAGRTTCADRIAR